MSDARSLFEYAILRVVPRIERGESMNAGILLYCRTLDYLGRCRRGRAGPGRGC
jgi:hypothetical protein